jgi:alkanesulfonate monooxygenase SsuD/methylene tetrahydromethanopterin reductase-like flavin-dependent oxidoreductase (luciferase family)
MPVVGRTEAEAWEKLNLLQSFVNPANGLAMLSDRLGTRIEEAWLDGPMPDLKLPDNSHGFAGPLLAMARRGNLNLRQLLNITAAARGHWVLCGTPGTIADTFEKWFTEGAADGFNIMPPYFPGGFDEFVDGVIPELQARGLYRTEYAGRTLREHLGLRRPALPA